MTLSKYSGAGNSFLFADNREGGFDKHAAPFLCQQEDVDGLILVENSLCADVYMRIYNSDGSEAEMCGNGLRCFAAYLQRLGFTKTDYAIETKAGIQSAKIVGNEEVSVSLSPPFGERLHLSENLHFLNTSVPHAVVFVEDIENVNVEKEGRRLRFSPLFAPHGANVNFVQIGAMGKLKVRTYERGVEKETLACGTGSTASALLSHRLFHFSSPIEVEVRSNQKLIISFTPNWSHVSLQGPVAFLGELKKVNPYTAHLL